VHAHGIAAIFSVLARVGDLNAALADAEHNVRTTARNLAAVLAMGKAMA